jgi:heme exporter protein B
MINALLAREFKNAFSEWNTVLTTLVYFTISISLVDLIVSNLNGSLVLSISGPITWILMMMVSIHFANLIFCRDLEDGSFDLLVLSNAPLQLLMLIKIIAHWSVTMIPLGLASLLHLRLAGNEQPLIDLLIVLLPITLTISAFISLTTLMTHGTKLGSLLLGVIVMPLLLPLLIFATAATSPDLMIININSASKILISFSILSLVFIPWLNVFIAREVNKQASIFWF